MRLPKKFLAIGLLTLPLLLAADKTVKVNVDNFVRAETAAQIGRALKMSGGVNKWFHYTATKISDSDLRGHLSKCYNLRSI